VSTPVQFAPVVHPPGKATHFPKSPQTWVPVFDAQVTSAAFVPHSAHKWNPPTNLVSDVRCYHRLPTRKRSRPSLQSSVPQHTWGEALAPAGWTWIRHRARNIRKQVTIPKRKNKIGWVKNKQTPQDKYVPTSRNKSTLLSKYKS
jgi:hypothetical protein